MVGDSWYQVIGSNYVGTIDVSADFIFETDIMLDEHYDFSSLCRFTVTNGNYGTYGDEILNIDVTSWNELFIATDTIEHPDIYEWTGPMPLGEKFHLKVKLEGSERHVWINGELVLYLDGLGARESHYGVQVWAADQFEYAANAKVKNVWWTNINSAVLPAQENPTVGYTLFGNQWHEPQADQYLGTFTLTKDFLIEFELELHSES